MKKRITTGLLSAFAAVTLCITLPGNIFAQGGNAGAIEKAANKGTTVRLVLNTPEKEKQAKAAKEVAASAPVASPDKPTVGKPQTSPNQQRLDEPSCGGSPEAACCASNCCGSSECRSGVRSCGNRHCQHARNNRNTVRGLFASAGTPGHGHYGTTWSDETFYHRRPAPYAHHGYHAGQHAYRQDRQFQGGNGMYPGGYGYASRHCPCPIQPCPHHGQACEKPDWWFLHPQTEPTFGLNPLVPPREGPLFPRLQNCCIFGGHPVPNTMPLPPTPTYTTRGPRDYFLANPPSIGY